MIFPLQLRGKMSLWTMVDHRSWFASMKIQQGLTNIFMTGDARMSRSAGELDGQQTRLEQGNVALIQQDAALIQLLSQDAAGLSGHQVQKFHLTILLTTPQRQIWYDHTQSPGSTLLELTSVLKFSPPKRLYLGMKRRFSMISCAEAQVQNM